MKRKSPTLDESKLKKGPWTPEEDQRLIDYINKHGQGRWIALPKQAGLNRHGKSCRLRWINYLSPDIKRGKFSDEEEQTIINLHSVLGNKWSLIAQRLPGRTDNDVKNLWNSTRLKKKLLSMGIDPVTHRPRTDLNMLANLPQLLAVANIGNVRASENALRLQPDATQLAKLQLLNTILQFLNSSSTLIPSNMEAANNLLSLNLRENSEFFKTNSQPQDCFAHEDVNHYNQFNIPSLESQQQQFNTDCHPMNDSMYCAENNEMAGSYAVTSSDVLPSLVSGSPKRKLENQIESYKANCVCNPSSSTTSEAWGNLKDNELSEFWREIFGFWQVRSAMASSGNSRFVYWTWSDSDRDI